MKRLYTGSGCNCPHMGAIVLVPGPALARCFFMHHPTRKSQVSPWRGFFVAASDAIRCCLHGGGYPTIGPAHREGATEAPVQSLMLRVATRLRFIEPQLPLVDESPRGKRVTWEESLKTNSGPRGARWGRLTANGPSDVGTDAKPKPQILVEPLSQEKPILFSYTRFRSRGLALAVKCEAPVPENAGASSCLYREGVGVRSARPVPTQPVCSISSIATIFPCRARVSSMSAPSPRRFLLFLR